MPRDAAIARAHGALRKAYRGGSVDHVEAFTRQRSLAQRKAWLVALGARLRVEIDPRFMALLGRDDEGCVSAPGEEER